MIFHAKVCKGGIIKGKDSRYKLLWSGNSKGTADVGVFVAEKWIEKVFEVKRISDQIILVKIIVSQRVLCLLSVYAPQCGLSDSVKDLFCDQLRAVTAMIQASEFLIPCGDRNGHVGSIGYEDPREDFRKHLTVSLGSLNMHELSLINHN